MSTNESAFDRRTLAGLGTGLAAGLTGGAQQAQAQTAPTTATPARAVSAAEVREMRIGRLTFESGYPSQESVERLYEEMDFQRACQGYLWGLPAVGLNEWRKAHQTIFAAKNGELLSYLNFAEKLGILTPNYTTPYVITLIDLEQSGPIVFELPAGRMAGMVLDIWQRVLADLSIVGPDEGRGGKYLILPPGHEAVQPTGYYVVPSPSRVVFTGVRLLDSDHEKAIAELVPGLKTYTWSPSGTGPVVPVRHAGDKQWSQMPPRGMAYWESLHELIQLEPVMERDRLILAQLRFLGIEKGRPFAPDARQRKLLEDAAVVGEAMAKANTSDKRVEPPFWPGTNWKHALVVSVDQRMPGYDQFDERAAWFYEAVAISKGMLTQTVGVGQRYIAAYKDKTGAWLSGANTYRLRVPANPPARGFWSVTAYDEDTRQMPVTPQGRPDISSLKADIKTNADGSIDVYFGPAAPPGEETNWVQTVPGKGWFAYFRFYGPTERFFDKTWSLPDLEKMG